MCDLRFFFQITYSVTTVYQTHTYNVTGTLRMEFEGAYFLFPYLAMIYLKPFTECLK